MTLIPNVKSEAKYCAGGDFFWTEITFRSKEEIHQLIASLTKLADSTESDAHFHLMDFSFSKLAPPECAEIIFYGPSALVRSMNEEDKAADVQCARTLLGAKRDRR